MKIPKSKTPLLREALGHLLDELDVDIQECEDDDPELPNTKEKHELLILLNRIMAAMI